MGVASFLIISKYVFSSIGAALTQRPPIRSKGIKESSKMTVIANPVETNLLKAVRGAHLSHAFNIHQN